MDELDPRHGTSRGYSAHKRARTEPCQPCRKAAADYERQRFYDAHLGRQRLVDATGSKRRIRALQAIGWPTRLICAELGYTHRDALAPLLYDAEWITRSRAVKIAELYERLCMTPGPSNITRIRALRAGFAPPLAWDDIDRDEHPTGMRDHEARRDLLAEWDELRDAGESIDQAAIRLGVTVGAIERAEFRAKRRAA